MKTATGGKTENDNGTSIDDITGQKHAKRVLEISAAGGHNLLLLGPPGTGKPCWPAGWEHCSLR